MEPKNPTPNREEDLAKLSKEELINLVLKLEQAKPKDQTDDNPTTLTQATKPKKKQKKTKEIDFQNCEKEYVAVKFAYIGINYQGLAIQENTTQTIEHHLFDAMSRTKMIKDYKSCHYSRCARTDAGVSALGNVFSAALRKTKKGDYARIINKNLPEDIRVTGIAPVHRSFDARFNCLYREYTYFFIQDDMNIERMRRAAKLLEGMNDFRNFCKIDLLNVKTFTRRILHFEIEKVEGEPDDSRVAMWRFKIRGFSFLWHQVRCMVAILFLIGRGKEEPEVITDMLDIENMPRKPQYDMASEVPLILKDCAFENVNFSFDPVANLDLWQTYQKRIEDMAITRVLNEMILRYSQNIIYKSSDLLPLMTLGEKPKISEETKEDKNGEVEDSTEIPEVIAPTWRYKKFIDIAPSIEGRRDNGKRTYIKLLNRRTASSYEERLEQMSEAKLKKKKQKEF